MDHSIDSVEECETCIDLLGEYTAGTDQQDAAREAAAAPIRPLSDERRRAAAAYALDALFATHEERCDDVDVHLRFAHILEVLWEDDHVYSLMDDVQQLRAEGPEPLMARARMPQSLLRHRALWWNRYASSSGGKDSPVGGQ